MRRKEIEIPEFVSDYDEELEYRLAMMPINYGIESDHPRNLCLKSIDSSVESSVSMYSMRCIA